MHSAAAKWKQLATRLHFRYNDIDCIQEDNPCQCENACFQVFSKWLSGYGRRPTDWSTLLAALKEAELPKVAKDLEVIITNKST